MKIIASYNGEILIGTIEYSADLREEFTLRTVQYDSPSAHYWVACCGRCYAFGVTRGQTCIATLEQLLETAMQIPSPDDQMYVVWAPTNRSKSAWARWEKKWGNRTNV